VDFLNEGQRELAENNFDEALEALNNAEKHFDSANHSRLFNKLAECYIHLITLYKESGDSEAAQVLCHRCYKSLFIDSVYAQMFEDIYENVQAENQMQFMEYIRSLRIHTVEDIEGEVIQIIGNAE